MTSEKDAASATRAPSEVRGAAEGLVGVRSRRQALSKKGAFTVVIAIAAAYLLIVWVQPTSAWAMTVFGGFSLVASPVFGAVACLVAYRRVAGSARLGWAIIGAGAASWAMGSLIWIFYVLVARWRMPFPSLADLGYLLTLPLMVVGMAALITARHGKLRTLLDALLVSASLLFVVWAFIIGPSVSSAGETTLELVVRLAYPVGDVAMATTALILLAYVGPDQHRSVMMLALGAFALSFADSAFAYLVAHNAYVAGTFVDFGWFSGFLLIGLAALSAPTDWERADSHQNAILWVVLPYVPLAVAIFASVVLTARRGSTGTFLYYLELLIVVLVVARQLVSVRDNRALTRQLGVAVDDLRARERQLHYLAFHDQLTDLANRALFDDRAEYAVARQNRTGDLLAILVIDLDGFKQVNDELGHSAGDRLLRAVAERLHGCVRASDTVARLGGDEFAVISEGLHSADEAEVAAARITQALGASFHMDGCTIRVTGSVGVALRNPGPDSLEEMLHRADSAMYAAKLAGKGRYVIASQAHNARRSLPTDKAADASTERRWKAT